MVALVDCFVVGCLFRLLELFAVVIIALCYTCLVVLLLVVIYCWVVCIAFV